MKSCSTLLRSFLLIGFYFGWKVKSHTIQDALFVFMSFVDTAPGNTLPVVVEPWPGALRKPMASGAA